MKCELNSPFAFLIALQFVKCCLSVASKAHILWCLTALCPPPWSPLVLTGDNGTIVSSSTIRSRDTAADCNWIVAAGSDNMVCYISYFLLNLRGKSDFDSINVAIVSLSHFKTEITPADFNIYKNSLCIWFSNFIYLVCNSTVSWWPPQKKPITRHTTHTYL